MSLQVLLGRAQVLQQEFQKAKAGLAALGEQMEQAKANFHMITGHLQEVAHLIGEQQKLEGVQPSPEPVKEDQGEGCHVEVEQQEQEQVA
jgi:hypothetical protein